MTEPRKCDREAAVELQCRKLAWPPTDQMAEIIARRMAPERERWAAEQVEWGEEVAELRRMVADERERSRRERELYRITIKDDGTWLELRGPTKKALIRLENGHGPIVSAAIREVREAIAAAESVDKKVGR